MDKQLDVNNLAKKECQLTGKIKLANFKRIEGIVTSFDNYLSYNLNFDLDENNRPVIMGDINSLVSLKCNRCTDDFETSIASEFKLVVVNSDLEAKEFMDSDCESGVEPLIAKDGNIVPLEVIEEELLLSLPLVPRHKDDCELKWIDKLVIEEKQSPFAKLKKLDLTS